MKVGELYYGISIPQSEFRRVEAQLKRFEQAMKQAGGREAAAALRDTGKAATEASESLGRLNKAWITLQNQYATGKVGTQEFVTASRSLQTAIGDEITALREKGQAVTSLEALQTRVAKQSVAEQERLTRVTREQAIAAKDATYANTRYAESSRLLADQLRQAQMAISNIAANEKAGLITKTEALRLYRLQQEELIRLRLAYQGAGIAASEMARATISINTAITGVSGKIETLRLKTEGFNTATLEGVKLSDSLTKAWLIGLGPQGYRLYLVMSVLKDTMTGVSASVRGAKNAFLALATVLKVGVIGTLLAVTGTIIAGLNQMLKIEDTMADVRKTTNLTAAEIQTLTDAFRSLSVRLPVTVNELAEIAVAAGQFGIRGTKNIFEFTKAIAELQLAVNDLGEDAATKIVRFLNVMGISLDRAGEATIEISGILNELENNTAATAGEILHMASGMAQLGMVANVSVRDVLAMSAGLVAMGVNAEMAGTNLSRIFLDVVLDVAKGTEAVNMWAAAAGMSRDAFVALTREANGYSKAFRAVAINLGSMGLSAEQLAIALENLGVTNQRTRRIMLALAAGWESFSDAVEYANDEVATAESIQRELEIRLGVTKSQIKILGNRFSAMAQIVGEYVLPRFASLIEGGNEGGNALAHFGAVVVVVFEALLKLGALLKASWLGIKSLSLYVVGALAGMSAALNSWSANLESTVRRWRGVFQDVDWRAMVTPGGMHDELNKIWYNFGREWGDAVDAGFFDSNAARSAAAGWFAEAEAAAWGAWEALEAFSEWRPVDTYNEVYEKLLLLGPEMADVIGRLREEAERDIDPVLFDTLDAAGGASKQTVEGLIAELYALMAAIDRMKPVMDELNQEYDVNAEKVKALQTGITKLVMEFGLSAESPEIRDLINLFLELGGALEDLEEKLKKALKAKEAVTSGWTQKLVFLVEYGGVDANAAYAELEGARRGLEAELDRLAATPNRNMLVVLTVQAQLADVKAAMDAIRDYTFVDMQLVPDGALIDVWEVTRLQAELEQMTRAWAEWDRLVSSGGSTEQLQNLYNELWAIAAAGGFAADEAQRMLEAFGKTHFPDVPTNQLIFGIPEHAKPGEPYIPPTGVPEVLEENVLALAAAMVEFNRITREAPTPIEALTTALEKLAEGEDGAAYYARRLLAELGDFVSAQEAAESLKKLTEAQDSVTKMIGEAPTPLRAAVTEYEKFRDAAFEASDPELAANWQALIDTLLRFETLDMVGYANTMKEVQVALDGGDIKDGLMKRLFALTQLGEGYEDTAAEALAAMNALREYQRVSAATATREQDLADAFARREENVEALAEAIRAITEATGPQLTQTQKQIQTYEDMAFLMEDMGAWLEPYIQLLRDKDAVEGGEALAAIQLQVAQATGVTEDKFLKHIPTLKALLKVYPFLREEIRAFAGSLHELSEAASRTEVEDKLDAMADRAAQFAGTAPTAIEAFIEELLKMADATKETFPDLSARFSQLANDMAVFDDATQKLKVEEQLTEMANRAAQFAGTAPTAIEAFIEELLKMADAAKDTFPELSDGFLRLASDMMVFDDATRQMEFDKALKGIQEQMDALQGKSKNPFDAFIDNLEESREKFKALGIDIDDFIPKLEALSAAFEKATKLDKSADDLELYLGIAETLFDLFQDGNWTDGNKLLDAVTEIGSTLVGLIPVIGPALSRIVSMVGQFINKIIGDMSSGIRQVQKQIDDVASRSRYLHRDLVEDLTATKQVSRGGLLGWLGFTKTAVDQELTDLRIGIAESFGSALSAGIMAALSGDTDWKTKLRDGIAAAISQALLDAFIQTALLTAGLADFVNDFTRILIEDGASAAAAYASQHMGRLVDTLAAGAEIIIGALAPFAPTPPPPEDFDDFGTTGTHGYFTLPTATPGIITATPAWVDNLGMHFAKFGMYVDRLVDEGILVNCSGGSGPSGGVKARDLRLAR